MSDDLAIQLQGIRKVFKKSSRLAHGTTLKSELVRFLTGRGGPSAPPKYIEALKHVDLSIKRGQSIGIIGANGSGKSTLLKLITGILTPTEGVVTVNGRISALLELGAGFHPDFTGRENITINGIILGMSAKQIRAATPRIIEFAEIGDFIDEPVRIYSSGMFLRLAFAVAVHVEPDILLIDEILAVGDEYFQHKSSAKLQEFRTGGKTIVIVAHSLETLRTWCEELVWIDTGVVRLRGPPDQVIDAYRAAVAERERAHE